MKIFLTLLMLSSILFSLDWEKDLTKATQIAQKEHKSIMLFVESDHCRWCKKMKQNTLADAEVEKRLKKFVLVKIMRAEAEAMKKLPKIYGVPSIFFMDENQTVVEDVVGFFNTEDFISYINDVEKSPKKK